MATFTKRVGRHGAVSWRALVRRKGVVACNTFPTKLQAQEWAAQVESDAVKGEYRGRTLLTLGGLIERFELDVVPLRRGARWEHLRLRAFREREKRLCSLPLSSLGVGAIEAYRDSRLSAVSSSTVRRELALLGAVLSQAVRWGLIRHNHIKDVRKPLNPPPRRRGIHGEEISAILKALGNEGASKQIAQAFLLSLETGMRCGEILGLTWDHVNLAERYVTLPKTKNGDSRQVPLSSVATQIIESQAAILGNGDHGIRDGPNKRVFTITGPTLDVLFRRARARAAVDCPSCATVRFHDARSEAITRLSRKLDVLELARVVGHRNLSSLMFYYRATAAEIAKKLD